MRRLLLALLLLAGLAKHAVAGDGFRLKLNMAGTKDSMVYLAHYFGKPMPTIYKVDSAKFDKNGMAVLQNKEAIVGGIYILLMSDMETYFEFLLNNGDNMEITANKKDLPSGVVYKNSPQNEQFQKYINTLGDFGEKQQQYQSDLAKARTKEDTAAIRAKSGEDSKQVIQYRKDFIAKNPNSLLANIFNSLERPKIPEGKHLLPDGKEDTLFAYNYYKQHYWDGFNFTDDRLVYTPVYDARLEEYFTKVIAQIPDSVEKEGDIILAKTRGHKELFKYTLHWLASNTQSSKVMGMDEAFVHFVENYYMKGDAFWLTPETLSKYIERARKIAPNVLGNKGADIRVQDVNKKDQSLMDVKAKYTLLLFWSPDCGACRTEVPKIDSVYRAVLKDKGVKIFAVRTEGDETYWKKTINDFGIGDWINVYDPERKSNFRSQYDVYGTPSMYLLDENKIIVGKKLDHNVVLELLNVLELKEKNNKKG